LRSKAVEHSKRPYLREALTTPANPFRDNRSHFRPDSPHLWRQLWPKCSIRKALSLRAPGRIFGEVLAIHHSSRDLSDREPL